MSTVSDMDRNFWPAARTVADLEYDGGPRDLAAAFSLFVAPGEPCFAGINTPWVRRISHGGKIRLSLAGEGVR